MTSKVYYKIGEVCELTGLKPSTLRFWEKEFKRLRPVKSGGGQRFYTNENLELIKQLKTMLHEEKYTLEGVKRKLEQDQPQESVMRSGISHQEIKSELESILEILK